MQLRRFGSRDECSRWAGVMRPLAGIAAEKVVPQDWHACEMM
jgi:hypothetical protein